MKFFETFYWFFNRREKEHWTGNIVLWTFLFFLPFLLLFYQQHTYQSTLFMWVLDSALWKRFDTRNTQHTFQHTESLYSYFIILYPTTLTIFIQISPFSSQKHAIIHIDPFSLSLLLRTLILSLLSNQLTPPSHL